jgi:uncharacterized membrane protein
MNGMMDGTGGGGDAFVAALLAVLWLVSVALAFGAGVVVHRRLAPPVGHRTAGPGDAAAEILGRRLASGEIDDEEYLRLRSALESR